MKHPTTGLVIFLIFLHCVYANLTREKRAIFSWLKGSEPEPDAIEFGSPPSVFKVHKYNGIKIHPMSGAPVYMQNGIAPVELTPQNIQQLDLLNQVSAFLPDGEELQNYDFTTLLPYVDLIPDDSLERIQFYVQTKTSNPNSKLLTVINYLQAAKERKLKQVQHVIDVGANLVHKKKKAAENMLWHFKHRFSSQSTTPTSVAVIPAIPSYPFPAPVPPSYNPFGPGGISHQTLSNSPSLSVVASSLNFDNLHQLPYASTVPQPSTFATQLSNDQYFKVQKPQLSLSEALSNDVSGRQQHSSNILPAQYRLSFDDHYNHQLPVQTYIHHEQFSDRLTQQLQSQNQNLQSPILNSPQPTNHRLPENDQFSQFRIQSDPYPQFDQSFTQQIHQMKNQNGGQTSLFSSSSQPMNHRAVLGENQPFMSELDNKIAVNHYIPANTYFASDLAGSASENVEHAKQQTANFPTTQSNTTSNIQPQTNLNFTTLAVTKFQGAVDGDATRLHSIISEKPPIHITASEIKNFEFSPNVSSTYTL